MIESNKLIAEFMGFSFKEFKGIIYCQPYGYDLICEDANILEDLKFHSDWNWLMEVVDKIETTSFDITKTKPYLRRKESFKGTTSLFGEFIISYDNRDEFKGWTSYVALGILPSIIIKDFDDRFNTKIEAYYNACIEFIKWFNENK